MRKKFIALLLILCMFPFFPAAAAETAEMTVLSGNTFGSSDYQNYQNRNITLTMADNSPSYQWEDPDGDLKATDYQNGYPELTGGEITNSGGDYVMNSRWGSPNVSSVIFDLGEICVLERVDIWAISTQLIQLGEITVNVKNGENEEFVTAAEAVGEKPDGNAFADDNSTASVAVCTTVSIERVTARYVKLDFCKAEQSAAGTSCYQYVLNEVVIMGRQEKQVHPRAEHVRFLNSDMEHVYCWDEEDLTIEAEVRDTDAVLITGIYDELGKLRKMYSENGVLSRFGKTYTIRQEIPAEQYIDGGYLKAFVWKSTVNLSPLCSAKLLPAELVGTGLLSGNLNSGSNVYDVCSGCSWVAAGNMPTADGFLGRETELFDGDRKTVVSVQSEGADYANLQIHFEDVMSIETVNVYANCSSDSYLSEYDVYASIDGVNYEYAASKINTVSAGLNRIMPVSLNLDGTVYASDLRIIMKKDAQRPRLELAEIEVLGMPPLLKKDRATKYTYDTEEPFPTREDIMQRDTAQLLSDGDTETFISSAGEYVSLIYSLDEFQRVEDVTIYGTHAGCELLTSLDGVNYSTAGFYPQKNGVTVAYGRAMTNAKYVRLVFRRGETEQISLSEVQLNIRPLHTADSEKGGTTVPIRARLKANNILYLDWSDYNQDSDTMYKVYIEKNNFASTTGKTLKQVYTNGESTLKSRIDTQYCQYAGLEPDCDYYIAVTPYESSQVSVTPVKIHTNSVLGGETLEGMFCINEYPNGGGNHVAHEDEATNLQGKLKLISDLEILSKTRYWQSSEAILNTYLSRGMSFQQYVNDGTAVEMLNSKGIYSFASFNEPDLSDAYKKNPAEFAEKIKQDRANLKKQSEKNLLAEASICGTDRLDYLEAIYEADNELGNYYDVVDVHTYCKRFEGAGNLDGDNLAAEAYSVPEHLFAKKEKILNVLRKYGDEDKPLMFTEIGWSTHNANNYYVVERVSREQQANFAARCYLIGAMLDVKNIFLYAFQDEGPDLSHTENQFGIVDWYGKPKPAYYTYYTIGKLLKNAVYVQPVELSGTENYGAVFYDIEKNQYLTALWNISGQGSSVTVNAEEEELVILDAYANAAYLRSGSRIDIGSAPIYFYSRGIPSVR